MYPVNSFIVCLCTLFVFGIVSGGVVAENRNVTVEVTYPLSAPNTSMLGFGFCAPGYLDFTQINRLNFSRLKFANIPPRGHRLGNGMELQCRDSSYCSSWAPITANCTRRGSSRQWDCSAFIYSSDLDLSKVQFECARQDSSLNKDCIYNGSCVMYHSLKSRSSNIGKVIGMAISGIIVVAVVIGICGCIRRCRARPVVYTTTTVSESSSNSTNAQTIAQSAGSTYVAPPVQALPYPPMYQPAQATSPAFAAATMQQPPPYSQQAAVSESQPAFNPQYVPYPTGPGPYDAPPTYNSATAGYPPSQRKF